MARKRIPWNTCEQCEGGIRSLSLYSGKCQKCKNAEKRTKRVMQGDTVNLNYQKLIKQIMEKF